MKELLLNNVLGAAVIAACITAIFAYINATKRNSLEYITEERKVWRADLRKIAKKVNESSTEEILYNQLIPLKVRINPTVKKNPGKNDTSYIDYLLWTEIKKIENIIDGKELNTNIDKIKREIIELIEVLLKSDWEQSKSEVRQSPFEKMIRILLHIIVIIFAALFFIGISKMINFELPFFFIIASSIITITNSFKINIIKIKSSRIIHKITKASKQAEEANKQATNRLQKATEAMEVSEKAIRVAEEVTEEKIRKKEIINTATEANKQAEEANKQAEEANKKLAEVNQKAKQIIEIESEKAREIQKEVEELLGEKKISIFISVTLVIIAISLEFSMSSLEMNWRYVILFLLVAVNFRHLIVTQNSEELKLILQKIKIIGSIGN